MEEEVGGKGVGKRVELEEGRKGRKEGVSQGERKEKTAICGIKAKKTKGKMERVGEYSKIEEGEVERKGEGGRKEKEGREERGKRKYGWRRKMVGGRAEEGKGGEGRRERDKEEWENGREIVKEECEKREEEKWEEGGGGERRGEGG